MSISGRGNIEVETTSLELPENAMLVMKKRKRPDGSKAKHSARERATQPGRGHTENLKRG